MVRIAEDAWVRGRDSLLAQLSRQVRDSRVLEAMSRIPREQFVPPDLRYQAYENHPLPIGYGQTISQPLIVALMTEALMIDSDDTVLEVGTGSGYQTALLSLLTRRVISVERVAPLARSAAERLARLGYSNVTVHAVEATLGWPPDAPYDAIIVTAAAPEVPLELLSELAIGGRLVIPVGSRSVQELVRIVKTADGALRHNLGPCRFVPLLGESAWPDGAV